MGSPWLGTAFNTLLISIKSRSSIAIAGAGLTPISWVRLPPIFGQNGRYTLRLAQTTNHLQKNMTDFASTHYQSCAAFGISDCPQVDESPVPAPGRLRLSPEGVAIRYAPPGDPSWTAEREAAFFQTLLKTSATKAVRQDSVWLVEEYARGTLGSKRASTGYISTLRSILRDFAAADETGAEVRVTQRMPRYGPPQSIRTVQRQMEAKGVMTKVVREQGGGFVGSVYVYAPAPPVRFRRATLADLEAAFRACERGTAPYSDEAIASTSIESILF